ncbi:MAG TPA: transaldolase [Candidatus Didemnitutus sp.]|nr:transaldolase [Candidatus Didemnitutus sp.]
MNPLRQLENHGQSVWLDFTSRSFVENGELRKLIAEDGVSGVTSNPAIFAEAIGQGTDYDDIIRQAAERRVTPRDAFEEIVVADIQAVADDLRETFERTHGRDGYVSLEVSPDLARDAEGSVAQANELWGRVDRPNLFIKIPGTVAGLTAIRQLTAQGINVNVTLLFGFSRYLQVVEAYLAGLEERLLAGRSVRWVRSVASFFLSRIDVLVDKKLEEIARIDPARASAAQALHGQTAIACAKQAYQAFREIHIDRRFQRLAASGAESQRLLWASTGTKNPAERDVRYVEALIGPDTISTMPRKTLEAFRDHGDPTPRLQEGLDKAQATIAALAKVGIDLEAVSRELEAEGVKKFAEPYGQLLGSLERKMSASAPSGR